MAFYAVLDVALHFESFLNIELPQQGFYKLRSRIFFLEEVSDEGRNGNGRALQFYAGFPYAYYTPSSRHQRKSASIPYSKYLEEAHISHFEQTFDTDSFYIKFSDQEVFLDNVAQFRCELAANNPNVFTESSFLLEIELLFCSFKTVDYILMDDANRKLKYRSLCNQLLRLKNGTSGIHEFFPVEFSEDCCSSANLMVHTNIIDFRFRVSPSRIIPDDHVIARLRHKLAKRCETEDISQGLDDLEDDESSMKAESLAQCANFKAYSMRSSSSDQRAKDRGFSSNASNSKGLLLNTPSSVFSEEEVSVLNRILQLLEADFKDESSRNIWKKSGGHDYADFLQYLCKSGVEWGKKWVFQLLTSAEFDENTKKQFSGICEAENRVFGEKETLNESSGGSDRMEAIIRTVLMKLIKIYRIQHLLYSKCLLETYMRIIGISLSLCNDSSKGGILKEKRATHLQTEKNAKKHQNFLFILGSEHTLVLDELEEETSQFQLKATKDLLFLRESSEADFKSLVDLMDNITRLRSLAKENLLHFLESENLDEFVGDLSLYGAIAASPLLRTSDALIEGFYEPLSRSLEPSLESSSIKKFPAVNGENLGASIEMERNNRLAYTSSGTASPRSLKNEHHYNSAVKHTHRMNDMKGGIRFTTKMESSDDSGMLTKAAAPRRTPRELSVAPVLSPSFRKSSSSCEEEDEDEEQKLLSGDRPRGLRGIAYSLPKFVSHAKVLSLQREKKSETMPGAYTGMQADEETSKMSGNTHMFPMNIPRPFPEAAASLAAEKRFLASKLRKYEDFSGLKTGSTASMNRLLRLVDVLKEAIANMLKILRMDLNYIAAKVHMVWSHFVSLLPRISKEISAILKKKWRKYTKANWDGAIVKRLQRVPNLFYAETAENREEKRVVAEVMRQEGLQSSPLRSGISKILEYTATQSIPIIFEVRYHPLLCPEETPPEKRVSSTNEALQSTERPAEGGCLIHFRPSFTLLPSKDSLLSSSYSERGLSGAINDFHLFVLVHGFQGSPSDMRKIKGKILLSVSNALVLASSSNAFKTEGTIAAMGERLAEEIKLYFKLRTSAKPIKKISFICHSMGGLIARASFQHLENLYTKFYSFITLATPHVGYAYHSSSVFDAGLWIMKKWSSYVVLKELTLTDASNIEDTYLYRLSKISELKRFRHICFISSSQDGYAPFESARVEIPGWLKKKSSLKQACTEMVMAILEGVSMSSIYRIDVNFDIKLRTFDSLIGRTAHIYLLDNDALFSILTNQCFYLFS